MTVRGIVTLQFVRSDHLGWHPSVPGGGRLKRTVNPGARRRTAARTVQDRAGAENSSGRSDSRKPCDYTDQGMAARQRALDRGYRGSRPPQPRDQSLHRSNKRRYF